MNDNKNTAKAMPRGGIYNYNAYIIKEKKISNIRPILPPYETGWGGRSQNKVKASRS